MPTTDIPAFIADWFARLDRLDPIEAFLPDLHPEVHWDMPGVDLSLRGHDRVRAWYVGILGTLQRPTEHNVSNIHIEDATVSFDVLLRARNFDGRLIEARAGEHWCFVIRSDGRPLITHYSVHMLEEAQP